MDKYLAILGTGLGIAGVIPIFYEGPRRKLFTLGAGVLSLLLFLLYYHITELREAEEAVGVAKNDIVKQLGKSQMTFEQLNDAGYYRDWDSMNRAIDSLVAEQKISDEKIEAFDKSGNRYVVRVYKLTKP